MKYPGSKNRHAKELLEVMLPYRKAGMPWVEPMVGGCNMIQHVDNPRVGADAHSHLISMWQGLTDGSFIPPKHITSKQYDRYKTHFDWGFTSLSAALIGYAGFNASYNGKFFGGYAGNVNTLEGLRYYSYEAYCNIQKQLPLLTGVVFINKHFEQLKFKVPSLIYCDPPYKGTMEYNGNKAFNHTTFWQWVRDKAQEGHTIFVSEYQAPSDFECIWSKEVTSNLKNHGDSKKEIERLFIYKGK